MEKRRFKAARLFDQGLGPSEVARRLGVRRQSAHQWQQQWKKAGVQALMSRGPAGPKRRLSERQCEQLSQLLIAGPEEQGYATALWTLPRVSKLITQFTGLRYHHGHIWKLLRHLGFSCQQPSRRAIERDEAAIAHWKKVDWPRIKKKPAARGAPSSSSTRAD